MQLLKRFKRRVKSDRPIRNPAAIPARMALWLGLIAVAAGYIRHIGPLMVIGFIVMAVGIGLWWVFRAGAQVHTWRVEHAERRIDKRLGIHPGDEAPKTKLLQAERKDRSREKMEAPKRL